jgi:hypothetical protein
MNKLVPVRRYGRLHRKTEASTQQLAHNLKLCNTLTVRVLSLTIEWHSLSTSPN